ncbi:hypothetical protein SDC9_204774 [bioreactor metagenome]|uniref:Uncharacterized protein n=1 Tax=bioreactor metagenome TaxID=1076179 RepID=A0A645J1N4_9ZZZZ
MTSMVYDFRFPVLVHDLRHIIDSVNILYYSFNGSSGCSVKRTVTSGRCFGLEGSVLEFFFKHHLMDIHPLGVAVGPDQHHADIILLRNSYGSCQNEYGQILVALGYVLIDNPSKSQDVRNSGKCFCFRLAQTMPYGIFHRPVVQRDFPDM